MEQLLYWSCAEFIQKCQCYWARTKAVKNILASPGREAHLPFPSSCLLANVVQARPYRYLPPLPFTRESLSETKQQSETLKLHERWQHHHPLGAEVKPYFLPPSSAKAAVVIYTIWALACCLPLLFPGVPGGLHHAEFLFTPAKLSLKVIVCSYGLLLCSIWQRRAYLKVAVAQSGTTLARDPQMDWGDWRRHPFLRKEFANFLKRSVFVNW